jgi:hypothetical protein
MFENSRADCAKCHAVNLLVIWVSFLKTCSDFFVGEMSCAAVCLLLAILGSQTLNCVKILTSVVDNHDMIKSKILIDGDKISEKWSHMSIDGAEDYHSICNCNSEPTYFRLLIYYIPSGFKSK